MPDKHRGDTDFLFPEGAFKSLSGHEPIQLFRVCEQEISASKPIMLSCAEKGHTLLFCLSGEGGLQNHSQRCALTPDTVVFLHNDSCDAEISASEKSMRILCLRFDISTTSQVTAGETAPILEYFSQNDFVFAQDATEFRCILSAMLAELCLQQPTMLLVKGYVYQLLITAYRHFLQQLPSDPSGAVSVNAVGHTVYAIIRYIDDHLFSMNNLMCMAQELGYSYNYLSHLFRRKTGMTIQEYVSQKKIEQSTRLLTEESYSITQIASMLNYDCIQSFSKAFRRAMHMSPKEFRALHGIHDHHS